jgi:hypothetical protein
MPAGAGWKAELNFISNPVKEVSGFIVFNSGPVVFDKDHYRRPASELLDGFDRNVGPTQPPDPGSAELVRGDTRSGEEKQKAGAPR